MANGNSEHFSSQFQQKCVSYKENSHNFMTIVLNCEDTNAVNIIELGVS